MHANSLRKVRTATRTQARAVAYEVDEFIRMEAAAAIGTLGHHMITAVSEEENAFFETEIVGPATVEVLYRITATNHDRLAAGDQPATAQTGEIHASIKVTLPSTLDRAGLFRMTARGTRCTRNDRKWLRPRRPLLRRAEEWPESRSSGRRLRKPRALAFSRIDRSR
jgi:hypothetical protein